MEQVNINMLSKLFKRKREPEKSMLTSEEKAVVKQFAGGVNSVRAQVEQIYRKYTAVYDEMDHDSVEMLFLSEVFSPCPDYNLKSHYRKIIRES